MFWNMPLQSHEYTWLFGYNGESQQQHQTASSATTVQQLAAETHITEQQLAQEIANAADWTDLLQLATEYQEWLTLELQLRLLFRCVQNGVECYTLTVTTGTLAAACSKGHLADQKPWPLCLHSLSSDSNIYEILRIRP